MSIASYIKVIGRGKQGAKPLDADQAADLLTQIYQRQVTDLEIGAFCLAMRIKGETETELEGFVRATLACSQALPLAAGVAKAGAGVVVLPSYNGARKLPNLTPLLAALLAREGAHVLVHGLPNDPTRLTTARLFDALSWSVVNNDAALAQAWQQGLPTYMGIADLCAPLDALLAVRWVVGLRNPGHTVAKLINPFEAFRADGARSVQVVNHTHREYADSLDAYLQHVKAHALLMRGTEGEPVADARRQPKFDVYTGGQLDEQLSMPLEVGVLASIPSLPQGSDEAETAAFIQAVLKGDAPVPTPIAKQVTVLMGSLKGQAQR